MEEGIDSPVSRLRRWRWGEQLQGYLALRLWKWSDLPLHQKSHRCRPLGPLSVFSPWALKEEEGGQAEERRERTHLGREREKYGERTNKQKNNSSSNMFQVRQVHVNYSKHILGETNS